MAVLMGVFTLLTLALALLDRVGLESGRTPQAIAAASLGLFALVALFAHGRRPADHYVAAHAVSSRLGGMATAGAVAGLAVLGISGSGGASGWDLACLVLGMLFGLALLAFAIAPRLRSFGGYSAGDLIAVRFGLAARLLAAVAAFAASALIFVGFLKAAQPILAVLFGIEGERGLYLLAGLTGLLLLPGGHRSLVWSQAVQAILLAAACITAVAVLVTPGATPDAPAAGEVIEVLRSALILPENGPGISSTVAAILLIGAATAALPMLLSRTLTTQSPQAAQGSFGWALLVTVVLVTGALALNALLDDIAGVQIAGVLSGDLFQLATLLATLPAVASGLLLAGALAALLAVGQAALHAAAGAVSHDVWDEAVDRRGPEGRRIVVARLVAIGLALGGAWLAARTQAQPSWLLTWALAFAGAGLFVPVLFALWWRGCTATAAVLGMAAGLGVAALLLFFNVSGLEAFARIEGDPAVGALAATASGVAAAALVAVAVSVLRPDPAAAVPRPKAARGMGRRQAPTWERPA